MARRVDPRVREMLRLIDFYRYALDRITGEQAARYRKLAAKIERQILELVDVDSAERVTSRQVQRVAESLREIYANGKKEVMRLTRADSLEIAGVALRRSAELFAAAEGAEAARLIRDRRALQTFLRFEDSIRSKRLLNRTGRYAERWAEAFASDTGGNWARVTTRVQAHFVRAAREGWSYRDIAAHMREVGELRVLERGVVNVERGVFAVRGHMSPEAFARGFTRAKANELSNEISVRLGEEAGIDKFANVGVPDERQSEECAAASAMEPMTREEWDASAEGPPPRHVLNCRCTLAAVPAVIADVWTPQENPYRQAARAA